MEQVARVRGVLYINDSKATNVNSVWYALESMKTPVVWIAEARTRETITPAVRPGSGKGQGPDLSWPGQ